MSDTDGFPELPPHLRLLKTLVTVLTGVMILGVIVVVGLLVTRFPATVTTPEGLNLPQGAKIQTFTQGKGWWAVVTQDGRLLVFGKDGELRQDVVLDLP